MPRIFVTDLTGLEREAAAVPGLSLMRNIRNAGFDELQAICGGQCACATCHVYVDPRFAPGLSAIGEDEAAMIEVAANLRSDSRLACQIPFTEELDGLRVTIAPEP